MLFHEGYALKKFIEDGYASAREIADALGISRQTTYTIFGNEKLEKSYVEKLRDAGYKINGLTVNVGVSNIITGDSQDLSRQATTGAVILHVPIEAEAGFVGGEITPTMNYELEQWTLPGFKERGYSFEVRGESMFPTFHHGEIVVTGVNTEEYDKIKRKYVYVIVTNENVLIKRLEKKSPGVLTMISDNSEFSPKEIKFDEVKIYRARRNVTYDLSKRYPK